MRGKTRTHTHTHTYTYTVCEREGNVVSGVERECRLTPPTSVDMERHACTHTRARTERRREREREGEKGRRTPQLLSPSTPRQNGHTKGYRNAYTIPSIPYTFPYLPHTSLYNPIRKSPTRRRNLYCCACCCDCETAEKIPKRHEEHAPHTLVRLCCGLSPVVVCVLSASASASAPNEPQCGGAAGPDAGVSCPLAVVVVVYVDHPETHTGTLSFSVLPSLT